MNLICFKGPNTVGRITSEKSIDVFVRKKPRSDDARLRWRTVLQSICEHIRFELSKVSAGVDVSLSQKIDNKNPRNMLLQEDWSKKCWMRDCTELQKLVEQRLARNWSHGFSSIILKRKFVFCSQYYWGKKRTRYSTYFRTYFTDPSFLVKPLCLLDWMAMRDVYWWMTTAPLE